MNNNTTHRARRRRRGGKAVAVERRVLDDCRRVVLIAQVGDGTHRLDPLGALDFARRVQVERATRSVRKFKAIGLANECELSLFLLSLLAGMRKATYVLLFVVGFNSAAIESDYTASVCFFFKKNK